MKYLAILLLIMGLIGIGIFGFTIFEHDMEGPYNPCVGSVMEGTECPTSIMSMTLHHISVLQTLTTTTAPSGSSWLLLLASLLLVSGSIFLLLKNLLLPKLESLPKRLRELALYSLYSRQRITSWLSLFELSPAL